MKWQLLKATAARWLLPMLMALAVAGIGTAWWHGYSTGKSVQRVEMQSELDRARAVQAEIADELEIEKVARRAAERKSERARRDTPDPTACDVAPVPDGVLDSFGYVGPRPPVDSTVRAPGIDGADESGRLGLGRGAADVD